MSFGGRDDVVYFAGDRLDIMGSVPVSFGADFIEHGSESDTAFLSFRKSRDPKRTTSLTLL